MFNDCWAVRTRVRHLTRDTIFSECSLPLQFNTNPEEERKAASNKTPIPLPLHQCQLCSETQPSWAQQKLQEREERHPQREHGGERGDLSWGLSCLPGLPFCPKLLSISKHLWPEGKMGHTAWQELAQAFTPSTPGWVCCYLCLKMIPSW